jgi:hypothetical protein
MTRISRLIAAAGLIALGAATSFAQAPAQAPVQSQAPVTSSNKFAVQYGYCFTDGQNAVYDKTKAQGVEECKKRCEADAQCAVFEIWEHTLVCKLYSKLPLQSPRPQSVFPNNKTARGEQAQAAIGVKIVRGF